MAAHHGREGAVALLLSRGANINAQTSNKDGLKTPLLEAVLMNRSAVVKLLLEKCDIKVNICDALHHTPLRHAVMDGLIDIVKLLAPGSDLLGRSVSSGLSSYFFLTREVKPKQNAEEILAILKEAYEVQVNPPAERPTHREEVVSVH